MKLASFFDKVIEYSFYTILLFVPLFFTNINSELFELNKMWLTWGITAVIGVAWFSKMIVTRRFSIHRTPLDIPLALFLLSQIISTIFSLDTHVSLWGYYSRFNGGLYSLATYVFLYYAFVSNLSFRQVLRSVYVSLAAGIVVALWGIPSHFGHDPTCLIFRGTFDVSCWTSAFQPESRIFSTLGQPAWLAAYISILIPLALSMSFRKVNPIVYIKQVMQGGKQNRTKDSAPLFGIFSIRFLVYLAIAAVFYVTLIFSNTRAGFLAFWGGNFVFWLVLFIKKQFKTKYLVRYFVVANFVFLLGNFFFGSPIASLEKISLSEIHRIASKGSVLPTSKSSPSTGGGSVIESGGTDSGKIRLYVWQGAIDAWKDNPIFGTGVETFAFAYYLHKPVGHNLTSEWDYLYNKAHNEYLNYLTTTGIVGLGTYMAIICVFLFVAGRYLLFYKRRDDLSQTENLTSFLIPLGLVAGYLTILASNFFGFSVVIINEYFFLIPGFFFLYSKQVVPERTLGFSLAGEAKEHVNPYQWTAIAVVGCIGLYMVLSLFNFWSADTKYALGYNLDRAGQYQEAYTYLNEAVKMRGDEPVYKDELSVNEATLATALAMQKDATNSALLAEQAINLSNDVVSGHPNNVVYWKDRLRIFYVLAQANPQYFRDALKATQQAYALAPTDAKIAYNLGVIYEQTGDPEKAVRVLSDITHRIKPDYRDAYYGLALAYHMEAVDKSNNVIHPDLQQKAIDQLHAILQHINPNDKQSQELLKSWGAE